MNKQLTFVGFETVYKMMVELQSKTPWIYLHLLFNFAKHQNLDPDICLLPKRRFWLPEDTRATI